MRCLLDGYRIAHVQSAFCLAIPDEKRLRNDVDYEIIMEIHEVFLSPETEKDRSINGGILHGGFNGNLEVLL